MTLSGATTQDLSWAGSDRNEGVLGIPQSSSITGTSPLEFLVSYLRHSSVMRGSYSSAKVQSVYSTESADRAKATQKRYYGKTQNRGKIMEFINIIAKNN